MSETVIRRLALAASCLALAILWCWLLPMLSRAELVRQQIQRSEQLGINPAAIYYTDVFEHPVNNTEVDTDAIDHCR